MFDGTGVKHRITNWFSSRLSLEIPSPEIDLFETGVLDSLSFVELLLHLEQEFGIRITLEELEIDHFRSVDRIAAFVLGDSAATPAAGGRSAGGHTTVS